jgi:tetratricopeptide (TPR) repeat protein
MNLRHDTRIHSIDVHLHPFGEWIELRDLTTGETLFRSEARQVADGIGLESVQSYRSEEGIPVYRDHQYAIAASYDNTSGVESDAMAVMYLGLFDPEFDASLLGDPQALAAKRRQRDAERIAELERTIAADPQDQVAHTRLAVALMADNEVEKALHHIQVAARLDPDNTVISQVEAQILERAAPLQR